MNIKSLFVQIFLIYFIIFSSFQILQIQSTKFDVDQWKADEGFKIVRLYDIDTTTRSIRIEAEDLPVENYDLVEGYTTNYNQHYPFIPTCKFLLSTVEVYSLPVTTFTRPITATDTFTWSFEVFFNTIQVEFDTISCQYFNPFQQPTIAKLYQSTIETSPITDWGTDFLSAIDPGASYFSGGAWSCYIAVDSINYDTVTFVIFNNIFFRNNLIIQLPYLGGFPLVTNQPKYTGVFDFTNTVGNPTFDQIGDYYNIKFGIFPKGTTALTFKAKINNYNDIILSTAYYHWYYTYPNTPARQLWISGVLDENTIKDRIDIISITATQKYVQKNELTFKLRTKSPQSSFSIGTINTLISNGNTFLLGCTAIDTTIITEPLLDPYQRRKLVKFILTEPYNDILDIECVTITSSTYIARDPILNNPNDGLLLTWRFNGTYPYPTFLNTKFPSPIPNPIPIPHEHLQEPIITVSLLPSQLPILQFNQDGTQLPLLTQKLRLELPGYQFGIANDYIIHFSIPNIIIDMTQKPKITWKVPNFNTFSLTTYTNDNNNDQTWLWQQVPNNNIFQLICNSNTNGPEFIDLTIEFDISRRLNRYVYQKDQNNDIIYVADDLYFLDTQNNIIPNNLFIYAYITRSNPIFSYFPSEYSVPSYTLPQEWPMPFFTQPNPNNFMMLFDVINPARYEVKTSYPTVQGVLNNIGGNDNKYRYRQHKIDFALSQLKLSQFSDVLISDSIIHGKKVSVAANTIFNLKLTSNEFILDLNNSNDIIITPNSGLGCTYIIKDSSLLQLTCTNSFTLNAKSPYLFSLQLNTTLTQTTNINYYTNSHIIITGNGYDIISQQTFPIPKQIIVLTLYELIPNTPNGMVTFMIQQTPTQSIEIPIATIPPPTIDPIIVNDGSLLTVNVHPTSVFIFGTTRIEISYYPKLTQNPITYTILPITFYISEEFTPQAPYTTTSIIIPPEHVSDRLFVSVVYIPSNENDPIIVTKSIEFTTLSNCRIPPQSTTDLSNITKWGTTCQNNGQCNNNGSCTCPKLFTDATCSTQINPCDQCRQSGSDICNDTTNYQCICKNNWDGIYCENSLKCTKDASKICVPNHGIPISNDDGTCGKCQCNNQWLIGDKCEFCDRPCYNGKLFIYCTKCGCNSGFSGETCQCNGLLGQISFTNGKNELLEAYYNALESQQKDSTFIIDQDLAQGYKDLISMFNIHFARYINITNPSSLQTKTKRLGDGTHFTFTLQYNCDEFNSNINTDEATRRFNILLTNLSRLPIIKQYFHFGNNDEPVVSEPEVGATEPELPGPGEGWQEYNNIFQPILFISNIYFIIIFIICMISFIS